jgi:hypothetical protein
MHGDKLIGLYQMKGIGPTLSGRNGEGDPYHSDGDMGGRLVVAGKEAGKPATMETPPALIQMKDAAFSLVYQGRSQ